MLHDLGDGLFYAEGSVRFYGIRIMTRMEVVVLPDGGLAVVSPLLPDDALFAALDAIGPVRHILSPNKIHNHGLAGFAARYPQAQLWASPGLPERRPDLAFDGTLTDTPHPDWAPVLDQHLTRGNAFFSEVALFHRASRTLIVADLVENLSRETLPSAAGRLAAKAGHIFGHPMASPEFRMYTDDPDAAEASLHAIAAWPFTRILMAHGDIIAKNAGQVFAEVVEALLAEARARSPRRAALYRYLAARQ